MNNNRTELEHHVLTHFESLPGWDFDAAVEVPEHILKENYDGYVNNKSDYATTPEEIELIDKFIEIVGEDIRGAWDFSAEGSRLVIQALETFGL